MSGNIILNLAISLDGYIADENGGFEWIVGDGSNKLNTIKKWDYSEFLKNIDVVVMGKNCFNQKFHNDFKEKEVYIATSEPMTDYDNIHFISNNICKTIIDLKNKNMNIFLFGGGILIDNFIKANIIDEYIIGIIPTILGKGIPLFLENNPKIDLHLEYYSIENGITILKYSKRKI
ncbi:dihydrofolate reductase family protein [Clostridium ihumii]|uniref:dihydrofolate reductase family protein n=1 Tax=Clostridium ihumii TaxID=1470356 RepID=UPI003D341F81